MDRSPFIVLVVPISSPTGDPIAPRQYTARDLVVAASAVASETAVAPTHTDHCITVGVVAVAATCVHQVILISVRNIF